jgi:hypothetical protein
MCLYPYFIKLKKSYIFKYVRIFVYYVDHTCIIDMRDHILVIWFWLNKMFIPPPRKNGRA